MVQCRVPGLLFIKDISKLETTWESPIE
uniref:Uncharacterized protein n=1 Tax=Anguilla anguilla TaxID=7936 RepID=A0A0E9QKX2_ANGAN